MSCEHELLEIFVNKSFGEKLFTKKCDQKILTKVFKKSSEKKYFEKLMSKICCEQNFWKIFEQEL